MSTKKLAAGAGVLALAGAVFWGATSALAPQTDGAASVDSGTATVVTATEAAPVETNTQSE